MQENYPDAVDIANFGDNRPPMGHVTLDLVGVEFVELDHYYMGYLVNNMPLDFVDEYCAVAGH